MQAQRHGAGLSVSEMVASMGVHHGNARTVDMLRLDPAERLTGIQLFGAVPEAMAEAARAAEANGAALVDINMGCPVPKICKTGAGAALLADPDHAAAIVAACAAAVRIPVTVKIRRGLTPAESRPVEIARRLADAGADGGHDPSARGRGGVPRHRRSPHHRRSSSRRCDVPVIASGDITTPHGGLRGDRRRPARRP